MVILNFSLQQNLAKVKITVEVFTDIYQKSIDLTIKWVNIMGKHDSEKAP